MGSRQLILSVIGAESTVPQTPRLGIGIIAVNETGKFVWIHFEQIANRKSHWCLFVARWILF